MPLGDPADWFDNLNVHVDDEELLEHAASLEQAVLSGRSRLGLAVWTVVLSAIGGALGGFTFSDVVRESWAVFIGYLLVAGVVLRLLWPVSVRVLGDAGAFQAASAFFWAFLLAVVSVLSGRIDTGWLFYTVSIGGGLFIGLMFGTTNPSFTSNADAWMMAALPLGGFSTWSAAALQRSFDRSSDPAWSEIYVGNMAAMAFMVPMAILMAMLSSRARGLAKMATLYLHNENFIPKAIEYLNEAIASSPRSADLYNLRGVAYSKFGDAARADADFRKVTELMPRAAEAHMNRGVDFIKHEDYDRAIDALKFATSVNPKLAMAFSNLGTAYQKKGDLDDAIASYDRAIALRPKYPVAFSNRAYSYHLKGDHDRAVADAMHALKLDPDLAMAHTNLGHALVGKSETALAIRSYRRSLELGADPEVERETLKALEKLGASATDDTDGEHEDDEDR